MNPLPMNSLASEQDNDSWRSFLRHLKQRGVERIQLVISDKCLGLVQVLGEFCPQPCWERGIRSLFFQISLDKGAAKG